MLTTSHFNTYNSMSTTTCVFHILKHSVVAPTHKARHTRHTHTLVDHILIGLVHTTKATVLSDIFNLIEFLFTARISMG